MPRRTAACRRWPTTPAYVSMPCTARPACTRHAMPATRSRMPATTKSCSPPRRRRPTATRISTACWSWFAHANDPQPIIAEGEWHGEILDAQRGADGFGYDPLFYVPTHSARPRPNSTPPIKNQLSHRGQAMQKLIARLPAL
jgi:hypothetical protein